MGIVPHRDWDFEDPLVVVGFPSQGLVGAIVASYLVPRLDMQLVASMDAPYFPPVASVREGRAISPVQFFASAQQCGIDGECSQLVVVRSDAEPPPDALDDVAQDLLQWCRDIGAERVVTLEGAPMGDGEDRIFAVPNLACEVDHEKLGSEVFPDGALSGLSASLLVEGNAQDLGVICLFTGVLEDMPDASAAARLVEVLDVLVPGIKMDAKPLEEQAQRFEEQLRASVDEARRAEHRSEPDNKIMYG
ncbi:MAG: PAC2 family protein [Candidatus Thermoplasmatota archaeon]|nr:PAC2 family protein [Candidatus Thermoplasmatota archaeon]